MRSSPQRDPTVINRFGFYQITQPWIGQYELDYESAGYGYMPESNVYTYIKPSSPRANV